MQSLNVSATANGLNYLPEYLADREGIFRDAGLDVSAVARDPWTGVLDDLGSGRADLALGGLWVPAMYAGSDRKLSVVCQLNHQFPMAIALRSTVAAVGFTLADLRGRTVLAPGAGGSAPYEFTAGLLREAGVDPADIRFVRDLSTAMLVELFTAGLGDAIIADLVTATELEAAGAATIVFRHLDDGGIMPNSVYYCRTDRVEELRERVTAFVASIDAAMRLVPTADPHSVDAVLKHRWPDKDQGILRLVYQQLADSAVWQTVAVDESASDRWMRILEDGGLVNTAPTYAQLADDTFMADYR
ncbi:ABC transporter substrate-binding protein [Streptomyces cylindrosporus]|uniref:Thiamine pyrimidine synthase n=1 Tax=Streptomyces cylindrosporus TaxID=2927583 RepID=A0ABS9YCJ4_9ACTN|nr:ABC transporter substrate-binding protein [Streptomyces cylindrosporus]MCI3274944.1 ABC transporter substrate-binding protein [Streptomyces cylindrosporus]